MTLLTATGSFAEAYTRQFGANIASIRELSEAEFIKQISQAETIVHNASTITSKELDTCIERNFDFTRFLIGQLETHNPNVHVVHISSMSVLNPEDETICIFKIPRRDVWSQNEPRPHKFRALFDAFLQKSRKRRLVKTHLGCRDDRKNNYLQWRRSKT